MKNFNGRLVGIFGTVIIHLIAAILFMSYKMHTLNKDFSREFTVEIEQVEVPPEATEKAILLPASGVERILKGDEEMINIARNIARNIANKPEEKIDPADYIDKVKDELIRDGKLGTDNYIDEQKRLNDLSTNENFVLENKEKVKENDQPTELQKMEANYQGPTRIYYDLAGRNHTYLPIPIYKCQISGKVVLAIKVNQKGTVEEAQVTQGASSTDDPCLTETAVNTAMISRFNPDINSPKIQTGTITYEFVAQ